MIEFRFRNVDFNGKIVSTTKKEGSFSPYFPSRSININNIKIKNIVTGKQVHNTDIVFVRKKDKGRRFPRTDGLITNQRNVPLGLLTADCLPLFFFIKRERVIGALHCGWKGIVRGIINNALKLLLKQTSFDPSEIFFFIGPHICKDCYQVKKSPIVEKIGGFRLSNISKIIIKKKNRYYIDLAEFIIQQLEIYGIERHHIDVCPICTKEDNRFFSFRENRTSDRFLSLIVQF